MYVIGNSATAGSVPMWSHVIGILEAGGNIGKELELQCARHPDTVRAVSDPDQFPVVSPEGGCDLVCGKRLSCGHTCYQKCHAANVHDAVQCVAPCPSSLQSCGHACPNRCGEPCAKKCETVLEKDSVQLACGHLLEDPLCWQQQDPTHVSCSQLVQKEVPSCKHVIEMKCSVALTDVFQCIKKCGADLPCGHSCRRSCSTCRPDGSQSLFEQTYHGPCVQICDQPFNTCSHQCPLKCHDGRPCPPCQAPCESGCAHSKCTNLCSEPCVLCISPTCTSACPHSRCTMPCAAPCNWIPCSDRCTKLLPCGHQCLSVCGEVCPSEASCQMCAKPVSGSQEGELITFAPREEADTNFETCIVPPCGHSLTTVEFDAVMSMNDFYEFDSNGIIVRLLQTDLDPSRRPPRCRTCRAPLLAVKRYGRITKEVRLLKATESFIKRSDDQYMLMSKYAQFLQEKLLQTRGADVGHFSSLAPIDVILDGKKDSHVAKIIEWSRSRRYQKIGDLYVDVYNWGRTLVVEEQPFRKLWDMVESAKQTESAGAVSSQGSISVPQTHQQLLAHSLLMRCHLTILSDFLKHAPIDPISSTVDLTDCWENCSTLASWAQRYSQPLIQAEAYLYYSRYCAIAQYCLMSACRDLNRTNRATKDELDEMLIAVGNLKQMGRGKLEFVEKLRRVHPISTLHLTQELESVKTLVEQSMVDDVLRSH